MVLLSEGWKVRLLAASVLSAMCVRLGACFLDFDAVPVIARVFSCCVPSSSVLSDYIIYILDLVMLATLANASGYLTV